MKSGNFVDLEFVVKGFIQVEQINAEHISRLLVIDDKPYIGMLGQAYTRQLTMDSFTKLYGKLNLE